MASSNGNSVPSTTPRVSQPPRVRWLFLDLNSYFASVEQEMQPDAAPSPGRCRSVGGRHYLLYRGQL